MAITGKKIVKPRDLRPSEITRAYPPGNGLHSCEGSPALSLPQAIHLPQPGSSIASTLAS